MLEIAPVTEHERTALYDMAKRSWLEWMPHSAGVTAPAEGAGYFGSQFRFDDPSCQLWWPRLAGKAIGFARLELLRDRRGDLWAEFIDFYIQPAYRRQGNGAEFAGVLIKQLDERGIHRIDLNSRMRQSGATAFWERLGFGLSVYRFRHYMD